MTIPYGPNHSSVSTGRELSDQEWALIAAPGHTSVHTSTKRRQRWQPELSVNHLFERSVPSPEQRWYNFEDTVAICFPGTPT